MDRLHTHTHADRRTFKLKLKILKFLTKKNSAFFLTRYFLSPILFGKKKILDYVFFSFLLKNKTSHDLCIHVYEKLAVVPISYKIDILNLLFLAAYCGRL